MTVKPPEGYRPNVGMMLLNEDGKVFVGSRIDTPDAWQMPQGGIDDGEDPGAAAMRELEEEIGTDEAEILFISAKWLTYDFPEDLSKKAFKGKWRGQAQLWIAMRFLGEDSDIWLETAHPEFNQWRWAPRRELVDLIVPFKREVYRQVIEEFEPKLRGMKL